MLEKSDVSVADALLNFTEVGLDVGFMVPTQTAMEKSIMDAHGSFRKYLLRNNIHNYFSQAQGEKRKIPAIFLDATEDIKTKVSLYRPETKTGDPRIWVYKLKQFSQAYNLIGLVFIDQNFYVVNCSDELALKQALGKLSALKAEINLSTSPYVDNSVELLERLREISSRGFIPTTVNGDTGIGMTLEAELGIAPNSLAEPDFKGIELKATRRRPRISSNRVTLFSKVPNWKNSPVKKAMNLLNLRGYTDTNGRFSLYHTLNGKSPNSLGLQLSVDYSNDTLNQIHSLDGVVVHDATWDLEDLRRSLRTKHPETFWVKADTKIIGGVEHFHYKHVIHTVTPKIEHLEILIEDGVVTLDYAMHKRPTGNGVRDHGYLFKILPSNFKALFPEPREYDLTR